MLGKCDVDDTADRTHIFEEHYTQCRRLFHWDKVKRDLSHDTERPLRTNDQFAQIKGFSCRIPYVPKIVPCTVFGHIRFGSTDRLPVVGDEFVELFVHLSFKTNFGNLAHEFFARHRFDYVLVPISKDNFKFSNISLGFSIKNRLFSSSIVADHTADCAEIARCGVCRHDETMLFGFSIKISIVCTWKYACPFLLWIDLNHPCHIHTRIHDDGFVDRTS